MGVPKEGHQLSNNTKCHALRPSILSYTPNYLQPTCVTWPRLSTPFVASSMVNRNVVMRFSMKNETCHRTLTA